MTTSAEPIQLLSEPPIVLDAAYVDILERLALANTYRLKDAAERLLNEIGRAAVVQTPDIPMGVVNIGSEITFRDDTTGGIQTVTLVLPRDANIADRKISVLTPIGAALIGLAEGASIDWTTRSSEIRQLTVIGVKQAASPHRR